MSKRNTETLYLRVDPEVHRMVQKASEQRQIPLGRLGELAFRQYLAETTPQDERKNLLSQVEEALVSRLEQRMSDVLRRVSDLYAREAFDHAEGLFLAKAILSIAARDERTVEKILANARTDATKRLKSRTGPIAEVVAEARGTAERLEKELKEAEQKAQHHFTRTVQIENDLKTVQQEKKRLEEENSRLKNTMNEHQRVREYEVARDEWALQQFEGQGMFGRKTFKEWRQEYQKQNPWREPRIG